MLFIVYLASVHRADSSNEAPVANGLTEFGEVSNYYDLYVFELNV